MRANGLPSFPDPPDPNGPREASGGGGPGKRGDLDPQSPEFRNADEKCRQYMGTGRIAPPQGEDPWSLDEKLKYAKCMRANGLPSFSDPDNEGQFRPPAKGSTIGPMSPQFMQADKACAAYKPQGNHGGVPGPAGARP
jgi:hypothetical protein